MKRVIINRNTGSSWRFKRFDRLLTICTAPDKNGSVFTAKQMDFIDFKAAKEFNRPDEEINFLCDKNNECANNFINDNKIENDEPSFYMRLANQTRNPEETILDDSDDESFLDIRDLQSELYSVEDRSKVTLDEFSGYDRCVEKFKKSLF